MKFWDSSSIVPLLLAELPRDSLFEYLDEDSDMLV